MTDYSVRMRCQAETQHGGRCQRRGRRIHGCPYWLCRQHYEREQSLDFYFVQHVLYPPQLLAS